MYRYITLRQEEETVGRTLESRFERTSMMWRLAVSDSHCILICKNGGLIDYFVEPPSVAGLKHTPLIRLSTLRKSSHY
jgi:hypothetical protein